MMRECKSGAVNRLTGRVDRRCGHGAHRDLARDRSGSVLALAAVAILVLAALIGGGVDMARAYRAERRLQAACDAGVLAGRRAVGTNGFDDAAEQAANRFFNVNYSNVEQDTTVPVFTPDSPDDGETIEGTATATLNTIIMGIFGFESLDLSVDCSASMGVGNSDIMFVLDNTGSMDDAPDGTRNVPDEETKLFALQEAMKEFYDTVATANEGSNARIRYGFVPYSSTVNVGQLIHDLDSDYLADSVTVPSLRLVNWNTTPVSSTNVAQTPSGSSAVSGLDWANVTGLPRYSSPTACTNALPNPRQTAWVNHGVAVAETSTSSNPNPTYRVDTASGQRVTTTRMDQEQRRTEYQCSNQYRQSRTVKRTDNYNTVQTFAPTADVTTGNATFETAVLQQRTFDVSSYKDFNAVTLPIDIDTSSGPSDPHRVRNITTTWTGCISERVTTRDDSFTFVSLLTGITPGEALDLNIDDAPSGTDGDIWAPLWSAGVYSRDSRTAAFEDLDNRSGNNSTDFDERIDNLEKSENDADTACPYEARLFEEMDEDDFDDYADDLLATGGTYHNIGLLWGARLSSPTGLWADTVNEEPDNGGTVSRHIVFMSDGDLAPNLTANTAYGLERHDRRVTADGNDVTLLESRHRARWLAVCEAIKARGIRLWVVAFGAGVTDTADLETCASDDSAFDAEDAEDLNEHFQEIANQVGELRVVQ
jgi:hypothetical protein